MKQIQRVRLGETTIEIQVEGEWWQLGGWRDTLARQGLVVVHPDLQPEGAMVLEDPADEESPWFAMQDVHRDPALAALQTRWAQDLEEPREIDWPAA